MENIISFPLPYEETDVYGKFTSGHFDPEYKKFLKDEERMLKSKIRRFSRGSKLLDIGCGSHGRTLKILSSTGIDAVGLDHSYVQISKAEEVFRGQKNVRLVYGDATCMGFEDGTFDLTICLGSTFGNMVYDKFKVLKEMKRVTRKNSPIMVSVFNEKARECQEAQYDLWNIKYESHGDFTVAKFPGGGIGVSERFSERKLQRMSRDYSLSMKLKCLGKIGYSCELRSE